MFLFFHSYGSVRLPNNLDAAQRKEVLNQIGFTSAIKNISTNYLLGGNDGIEFSSLIESINFTQLNSINNLNLNQESKVLPRFGFSKGFYHNLEFHFQFIPFFLQSDFSGYGASVRYTFFQDDNQPFIMDLYFHGSGLNFANLIGLQNVGYDIVGSYFYERFIFSVGLGPCKLIGTFIGGENGLTNDKLAATDEINLWRMFSGLAYSLKEFQVGVQVDKFKESMYSFKISKKF